MNKIVEKEFKRLKKLYVDKLIIFSQLRKVDGTLSLEDFKIMLDKDDKN